MKAEGDRLRVNAPKGVLSVHLRGQLIERKQEVLEFLRVNQENSIPPPIPRRTSKGPAPLSFAQERLWFLEQLNPDSAVFNNCRASRLTGKLNIAALESGLNEILRRHEVLRAAIRVIDGRPSQIAQSDFRLELPVIDLQNFANEKRDSELQRCLQEEVLRPFDFGAGQFLRPLLLRTAENEQILALTTHHMMADAWSMGILIGELWTLYEAFANHRVSQLEDLPLQYSDFAVWQRNWLQGQVLESQLSYWKNQLADISILNLPSDHTRPPRQSFRGARVAITLPESLTAAINNLSYRFNVTPFITLLAAFQVLLYRYSGQEDMVVGSPVANRSRSELESLIGFFVNTLVLRGDLSGSPSFNALLSRVRDVCLGAFAHQDLPFEKLVEELKPERDQSRNPLFQVMFVLQNATKPLTPPSGIRSEPVEIDSGRSQFDLSLFLRERDGKLIGFIEYSTDLFNCDRIERMRGHFQRLLEAIVADPQQSISRLPILTESERHQILIEWNETAADYPKDKCVHELFEDQAERTPDAVALEFEEKQITYRELNRRANQLAHYLIALGVGPESLVGVCIRRSPDMVVALLGILKAGGAYVPLDPGYPAERLAFMLEDAKISILLTGKQTVGFGARKNSKAVRGQTEQTENIDPLSALRRRPLKVFCLEESWKELDRQSGQNPPNRVTAINAVYVIYTSGSTGLPKGVVGVHRAAVNRFAWMWRSYLFKAHEKCCGKTSLGFVDSVWEIFGPLLQGIPSVLLSDEVIKDPPRLIGALREYHVTRIGLVPSLLKTLLDTYPVLKDHLPELELWCCSGEVLPKNVVEQFRKSMPCGTLLNLYGSTEVCADVTCFDTRAAEKNFDIPIGRPISNTQIYLLDSHLQLVPIGVPGELCVGGDGVAPGYWKRPELTAQRFVTNSLSDDITARLYRTGDFARYLPNGNIEFLGRADQQIKIRGHRIELGEIEATLNRHPAIRESVVMTEDSGVRPRGAGESDSESPSSKFDRRLVAYFVPAGTSLSARELRDFLRTTLPDFMLPSVFVPMEKLPLTPSGKIDRESLPGLEDARPLAFEVLVEPVTEVEQVIAALWQEVLKLEKVGVRDNFFELGGHSLLAVQIVSRAREVFRTNIPLRTFFETATVRAMAEEIQHSLRQDNRFEVPRIVPVRKQKYYPLSLSQEQLWALDQAIPGNHLFNMAYAYKFTGSLNVATLEQTLTELVRRQASLRTVFVEVHGQPVQKICRPRKLKLRVVELRKFPPAKIEEKFLHFSRKEASAPFQLARRPPFRVTLFRLADDTHILLVAMHHIIGDRLSIQVLGDELVALYSAFVRGKHSPLPNAPIQFVDFVCWQRQVVKNGFLNSQLNYWTKQLRGAFAELTFATNRKRKGWLSLRVKRQSLAFDDALLMGVRTFARKEHCTPFMILVTALNILIYHFTGHRDIRIGTMIANRSHAQTGGLIGHFVNTVILRTKLAPRMTVMQLLKKVQGVTIEAYTHQDLPFEQLARALENKLGISRPSLFQVLFNYQSIGSEPSKIPGLTIASLGWQQPGGDSEMMLTALDLILNLTETSTELTGSVNYKSDIFDRRRVAVMMDSFRRIVVQILAQPSRRISSVTATL